MKISFAAPVEYLHLNRKFSTCFFCIAPVAARNQFYNNFYTQASEVILDNGYYEYIRGKFPLMPFNKVIDLALEIKAKYIILPDEEAYNLNGSWLRRWEREIPKELNFFVVYHYYKSTIKEIKKTLQQLDDLTLEIPRLQYVGIPFFTAKTYSDEVRWTVAQEIERGKYKRLKFHLLGMGNPNTCFPQFDSVDTAGPIWQGLNGVRMVPSIDRWWDKEKVPYFDFFAKNEDFDVSLAEDNCRFFTKLCGNTYENYFKKQGQNKIKDTSSLKPKKRLENIL
jgi:hypothetical protein